MNDETVTIAVVCALFGVIGGFFAGDLRHEADIRIMQEEVRTARSQVAAARAQVKRVLQTPHACPGYTAFPPPIAAPIRTATPTAEEGAARAVGAVSACLALRRQ